MKYISITLTLLSSMFYSTMLFAVTSHFQMPIRYGGVDNLDAWNLTTETFVPITVRHYGEETRYYIEVNNRPVSDIFLMEGDEEISIDVPVELEHKHGAQNFKVCSVALHGSIGSRICTDAELFLIEAIK